MGQIDNLVRQRIQRWLDADPVNTQVKLAEAIGRNQSWMSRYLDSAFDADMDTIKRMAHELGHSFATITGEPPDPALADAWEAFLALTPQARKVAVEWFSLFEKQAKKRSPARGAGSPRERA